MYECVNMCVHRRKTGQVTKTKQNKNPTTLVVLLCNYSFPIMYASIYLFFICMGVCVLCVCVPELRGLKKKKKEVMK